LKHLSSITCWMESYHYNNI